MDFNEIFSLNHQSMPDIAARTGAGSRSQLDWVGMSDIEMPIILNTESEQSIRINARIQAYVDLVDTEAKGIHMSRLYLILDQVLASEPLNRTTLRKVLEQFAESHKSLSTKAFVEFKFDYLERRKSLKSDNSGWKAYPVKITGVLDQGRIYQQLQVEVPYSSTCPCSAALARQLIQQKFLDDFAGQDTINAETVHQWLGTEEAICATPHSQRSYAKVKVQLSPQDQEFLISELIDQVEDSLKTPVQAAVKREDEQEFARLNASNLMFCEDASRRIKSVLDNNEHYIDYWVRVDHVESLHPHNAVSVVTKGIDEGYKPIP